MSQNTHNVRTRREQLATYPESVCVGRYSGDTWQLELDADDLDPDQLVEGPVLYVRCDIAHRSQTEAEARGAAEERAKGGERWEFEAPDYHDQGMGCGLEDRGIHDRYRAMEYGWDQAIERCVELIPEELYTRPANVAGIDVDAVIRNVSELPDRTSPDDQTDLLMVTADELRLILSEAQPANVSALEEALLDPATVHQNMLRGSIAKPTWDQIKHLYAAEFASLEEKTERLFQHVKRGTEYRLIGRGKIQQNGPSDMAEVVIYQDVNDGSFWVRSPSEFYDVRFKVIFDARAALTRVGGV